MDTDIRRQGKAIKAECFCYLVHNDRSGSDAQLVHFALPLPRYLFVCFDCQCCACLFVFGSKRILRKNNAASFISFGEKGRRLHKEKQHTIDSLAHENDHNDTQTTSTQIHTYEHAQKEYQIRKQYESIHSVLSLLCSLYYQPPSFLPNAQQQRQQKKTYHS